MSSNSKPEGLTVVQYAEAHHVSETTVRRAIADGYLEVDRDAKPTRVIGGELPVTAYRWRTEVERAARANLAPGTFGIGDRGSLEFLRGSERVVIERDPSPEFLERTLVTIAELGARR